MPAQELATARQHEAPIVVLVVDNGMYGTIRMHQERRFPGRVSGTGLENPDLAALARGFAGHGKRVESTEDVAGALDRALGAGVPAVLHLLVDPEALTHAEALAGVRRGPGVLSFPPNHTSHATRDEASRQDTHRRPRDRRGRGDRRGDRSGRDR